MTKTRLTIIRHGETEWNLALRLQGMKNSELTRKGLEQARVAARALKDKKFDRLITSDLKRAVITAEILNEYHHLPVLQDETLRERNFGIMEGLTREEIQERYPETFNGYMLRKDTYQIPEGESLVSFYKRVTTGIRHIAQQNKGCSVLIVTHGGVLDCIMRMIFDYPLSAPRRFSIYNASINNFSIDENEWQLDTWGNIDFQKGESVSLEEPKE
jgi:probable phosphoglycerate mutase